MSELSERAQLEAGWKKVLASEFESEYMQSLRSFLQREKQQGKTIYPPGPEIFSAFQYAPFDQVKVVVLGQDPYHGPNQAHGLCFSVRKGVRIPPSLVNIYKEIEQELSVSMPDHGNLEGWADQGILLLNATLTVEAGQAGSHQKKGWEQFTDAAIDRLNRQRDGLVFLLWGGSAQKKGRIIDRGRHLVLESPHPSPLSAHRGFFGCGHFARTNEYLIEQGRAPIDWARL